MPTINSTSTSRTASGPPVFDGSPTLHRCAGSSLVSPRGVTDSFVDTDLVTRKLMKVERLLQKYGPDHHETPRLMRKRESYKSTLATCYGSGVQENNVGRNHNEEDVERRADHDNRYYAAKDCYGDSPTSPSPRSPYQRHPTSAAAAGSPSGRRLSRDSVQVLLAKAMDPNVGTVDLFHDSFATMASSSTISKYRNDDHHVDDTPLQPPARTLSGLVPPPPPLSGQSNHNDGEFCIGRADVAEEEEDVEDDRDVLFCKVFLQESATTPVSDLQHQIGFIRLESPPSNNNNSNSNIDSNTSSVFSISFADARRTMEMELIPEVIPADMEWRFVVPTLGPVSRRQETLFGPLMNVGLDDDDDGDDDDDHHAAYGAGGWSSSPCRRSPGRKGNRRNHCHRRRRRPSIVGTLQRPVPLTIIEYKNPNVNNIRGIVVRPTATEQIMNGGQEGPHDPIRWTNNVSEQWTGQGSDQRKEDGTHCNTAVVAAATSQRTSNGNNHRFEPQQNFEHGTASTPAKRVSFFAQQCDSATTTTTTTTTAVPVGNVKAHEDATNNIEEETAPGGSSSRYVGGVARHVHHNDDSGDDKSMDTEIHSQFEEGDIYDAIRRYLSLKSTIEEETTNPSEDDSEESILAFDPVPDNNDTMNGDTESLYMEVTYHGDQQRTIGMDDVVENGIDVTSTVEEDVYSTSDDDDGGTEEDHSPLDDETLDVEIYIGPEEENALVEVYVSDMEDGEVDFDNEVDVVEEIVFEDDSAVADDDLEDEDNGDDDYNEKEEEEEEIIGPNGNDQDTDDKRSKGFKMAEQGEETSISGETASASCESDSSPPNRREQMVGTPPPPPPRLIMLVTLYAVDREIMPKQKRAIAMLESCGIVPDLLDGSDPTNRVRRNELFDVAGTGRRGEYPLFFWQRGHNETTTTYIGDYDTVQQMREEGTLGDVLGMYDAR